MLCPTTPFTFLPNFKKTHYVSGGVLTRVVTSALNHVHYDLTEILY